MTDDDEVTCRIVGKTFDEVEALAMAIDLPFDILIHGTRDESRVYMTGRPEFVTALDPMQVQYELEDGENA